MSQEDVSKRLCARIGAWVPFSLLATAIGWAGVKLSEGKTAMTVFDNLHWTAGYASGALLALRAWSAATGDVKTIAGWATVGLCALTVGQLVWDVQVALGWLPFPGPSDLFFVSTGFWISVGLWRVVKGRLETSALRALVLDVMVLLVGTLSISMVLYLPRQGTYTLLQLLVMAAYPVSLALPASLALTLLLSLRCRLSLSVIALPVGLCLFAACWIEWNLRFLVGKLTDGAWLNLCFSAVAILLGWSISLFQVTPSADAKWDRRSDSILRLMPIVMIAFAIVGVALVEWQATFSREVKWIALAGAVVAVVLAVVRQSYLLGDRDRLLEAERMIGEREQQLEALNRELEMRVEQRTGELAKSQKLAALGALVAGVAHELSTPIGNARIVAGSINYRLNELNRQMEGGGTVHHTAVTAVIADSRKATEMIEQSLDRASMLIGSFKQIAVDRTGEQRRPFDLSDVIVQTISVQRAVFKRAGCIIHVDAPKGQLINGYPGSVGQLLDILVENANRHGFDGRRGGEVTIRAETTAEGVAVLTVSDNGNGIPEQILGKIFDPFFTTQLGRGGSGLGLNIAWNIVEGVLGGKIFVSSMVGSGTTFRIVLPLNAP